MSHYTVSGLPSVHDRNSRTEIYDYEGHPTQFAGRRGRQFLLTTDGESVAVTLLLYSFVYSLTRTRGVYHPRVTFIEENRVVTVLEEITQVLKCMGGVRGFFL